MLPNLKSLLPKWKFFPKLKEIFHIREHALKMKILWSRIENISPVIKTLGFNLGSMLPV